MQLEDEDRAWAKEHGYTPYLEAHLAYFNDFVASSGKRYKAVRAAFRNSVRADWGNVRKNAAKAGVVQMARPWRAGNEPDEVLRRALREMQLEPWAEGETHGQVRARIVAAGGEDLLKPSKAA